MHTSQKIACILLSPLALIVLASIIRAADPGQAYPAISESSDQKAGSILIYNLYSSNPSNPQAENTRINISNTSSTSAAFVHIFFIDGASSSVADSYICLAANQTTHFLTSDFDPGVRGYIVAVAVDGSTGRPIKFNFLIGDEFVKLASGHSSNLNAESIAAFIDDPAFFDSATMVAGIRFDGIRYNRIPRVLATSNLQSPADGNRTLLVINRIGGSLSTGLGPIGPLFGLMYDDAENVFSFTMGATANVVTDECERRALISFLRCIATRRGQDADLICTILAGEEEWACQLERGDFNFFPSSNSQTSIVLSDTSLRTALRLSQIIPAGRSGWLKFHSANNQGILGAAINFNPNSGSSFSGFNNGRNLHKLSLTTAFLFVPVFPPSCRSQQ